MIFFSKKQFFSIVLAIVFLPKMLLSQSKTDSVRTLNEVVVTENALKNEIRSTSPVQTLSNKTLQLLNVVQVSDAVKFMSGVIVKDYGGIGGMKTISVRGFGANHTAVSYDGVKVSDMQTGQIDIGKFSRENIETISLYNAQSDNIFQSASLFASASVLNIKTLQPKFENGKICDTKIGIKYGSYGLFNPFLNFDKKLGKKFALSLNGEWISATGNYPFRMDKKMEGNDTLKRRTNSDVKNLRLETTLRSSFSNTQNGYLKLVYFNSERGLPGAVISYNPTSSKERLWGKNLFAQSHYFAQINQQIDFQANAKFTHDFTHYLYPKISDLTYAQQETYGSLCGLYKYNQNLTFSISSDLIYNILDANLLNFIFPSRLSSLSVLAGKYVTNRVSLTSSLLFTTTRDDAKQGILFENQKKWSPYAGISVKPFEKIDFRFRAFYKNVFRLPTFNDLYYVNFGNRNLKPEDTNQLNIGGTYSFSNNWIKYLSITTDVYHNEVKNKIVAFPSNNLFIWTTVNYGKVEIKGANVNVDGSFDLTNSINLTSNNSFTYQYAVDKTNPDGVTFMNQLPYIPRFSGGSSAVLDLKIVAISYGVIWSGKRYFGFQNLSSNRLEGFMDHNLSISKKSKWKYFVIETSLQASNVSNSNYEIVKNYPMQGRSFRINITTKF